MENKLRTSRIDFAVAGDQVVVTKFDEFVVAGRALTIESYTKPLSEIDSMLDWCKAHGFVVRRFLPLGARAWFGEKRPVRTEIKIKRLRDELTARMVPGLNVHTLDLLFDC